RDEPAGFAAKTDHREVFGASNRFKATAFGLSKGWGGGGFALKANRRAGFDIFGVDDRATIGAKRADGLCRGVGAHAEAAQRVSARAAPLARLAAFAARDN